jgi:hypothetical protein
MISFSRRWLRVITAPQRMARRVAATWNRPPLIIGRSCAGSTVSARFRLRYESVMLGSLDGIISGTALAWTFPDAARERPMALYRLRERIGTNLYREVVQTVRGAAAAHEEWVALRELLRW